MKTVLSLSIAYLRERPLRLILTSLATMAAAAMVVWVVSGYDALLGTFDRYSNLALGRYPLSVAPISHFSQDAPGAIPSHAEKFVPSELLGRLRADPAVEVADPMWAVRMNVRPFVEEGGEVIPWKLLPDARLLATDSPEPPFDLVRGEWINPADTSEMVAALSENAAEGMALDIGGSVLVGNGEKVTKFRIIGIVSSPEINGWSATVASSQLPIPGVGGLYVPTALAEKITGDAARISFIGIGLKSGTDLTKFRFGWAPRLGALSTPCQFQEAHDIEEALDESASAENLKLQAQTATVVSMLAALFIIFSTLNMGVTERVRQFATLRAVALTRAQVGMLIAIEGFVFGTVGFLGGWGAGWLLMELATRTAPELLEDGAVVGKYSILLAALCAYGGALLASLVPAIRAMRVRPVDAMVPRSSAADPRISWGSILTGLVLLAIYPFVSHGIRHGDDAPTVIYMFLGVASLAAGFILLTPATVLLVDRIGSPWVARLTGVPVKLLASQISGSLGRTVATSIALSIGLGLYIGIQVWGHTMLSGFLPGTWAPDAVIAFRPRGVAKKDAARIADLKGVTKSLPIIVEQPRLRKDLTGSARRATVVRQDNVVIVGIDPQQAFGGDDPLFQFEWAQGGRDEAVKLLSSGRGCIVPDHFLRETKLKVGDSFELMPPGNPENPVSYVIAGAVKLPGWHWQTKPTGFRTRTHRAAALVFAGYDRVAADFGFQAASHVWLNYDPSVTTPDDLVASAKTLYQASLGQDVAIEEAANQDPYVLIRTIHDIRTLVHSHATQWLWVMSRLPMVILVITSVGVLNALLASVQSRRWEMGVLRSIGFTRGTIVRLVIAEGILMGLVACFVSLVFGILAGWCGAGISSQMSFFGGMDPTLVIPWAEVLLGLAAVLVLASLAAIWPAVMIGKMKPLDLLQQGRGAF